MDDEALGIGDSSSEVRPLPVVTEENRHFWTGGANGELRILRCDDCRFYIHPPSPRCPACTSSAVAPQPVSGRGHLYSFTVNHHLWTPAIAPPYVIGVVELIEQEGLRLTTNVVECPIGDVEIGMPVEVRFLEVDDVYVPLFAPEPH